MPAQLKRRVLPWPVPWRLTATPADSPGPAAPAGLAATARLAQQACLASRSQKLCSNSSMGLALQRVCGPAGSRHTICRAALLPLPSSWYGQAHGHVGKNQQCMPTWAALAAAAAAALLEQALGQLGQLVSVKQRPS